MNFTDLLHIHTSLYEDIIRSMASAELISRFLAVVKTLVLSLTPPSGSSSTEDPNESQNSHMYIMKSIFVQP